jgi:hypothetical protein
MRSIDGVESGPVVGGGEKKLDGNGENSRK